MLMARHSQKNAQVDIHKIIYIFFTTSCKTKFFMQGDIVAEELDVALFVCTTCGFTTNFFFEFLNLKTFLNKMNRTLSRDDVKVLLPLTSYMY